MVQVELKGKPLSAVSIIFYDMSNVFEVIEPLVLAPTKKYGMVTSSFNIPAAGAEYFLQVESANGERLKERDLEDIKLNGTKLFKNFENHGEQSKIIQTVILQGTNQISKKFHSKKESGLKISIFSIIENRPNVFSPGRIEFANFNPNHLMNRARMMVLNIVDASIDIAFPNLEVSINGEEIDATGAVITTNSISLPILLAPGFNSVRV